MLDAQDCQLEGVEPDSDHLQAGCVTLTHPDDYDSDIKGQAGPSAAATSHTEHQRGLLQLRGQAVTHSAQLCSPGNHDQPLCGSPT